MTTDTKIIRTKCDLQSCSVRLRMPDREGLYGYGDGRIAGNMLKTSGLCRRAVVR